MYHSKIKCRKQEKLIFSNQTYCDFVFVFGLCLFSFLNGPIFARQTWPSKSTYY